MEEWDHGGGFSCDASVRIEAHDLQGLERLLRYCATAPLHRNAADRLKEIDAKRIYHLPKPGPDGQTQIILSPLELIGRIAAPATPAPLLRGSRPQLAPAPAAHRPGSCPGRD